LKNKNLRLQKKASNSYEKPILLEAALPQCPLSPYNSSSPYWALQDEQIPWAKTAGAPDAVPRIPLQHFSPRVAIFPYSLFPGCSRDLALETHPWPFSACIPLLPHPDPPASRNGLRHGLCHHPLKAAPQENSTGRHSKAPSAWRTHARDLQHPTEGNKTIRGTYLDWVCLVRFFMVKPSFPMIAPTNCVGTSIRSGKSSCLGCEEPPGEEPRSLEEWPPRRDRCGGGGELTSSSGM